MFNAHTAARHRRPESTGAVMQASALTPLYSANRQAQARRIGNTRFEAGRTYSTTCTGDAELVIKLRVLRRTDKTIVAMLRGEEVRLRVGQHVDSHGDTHESVFPDGRSSLAAMIDSSTPHV